MEEVVAFKNQHHKTLFGIVHSPDETLPGGRRIGVNLLNPGIKYRVAPHRLNVKIARHLCREGAYVLRFDPEGIGDSEGDLPSGKSMIETWGLIQRGLFVNDAKLSNDFFINNYHIEELIMIGNCGGAMTAILTAAIDPRVTRLILIDVPVILLGSEYSFADRIVSDSKTIDYLFKAYLKKLLSLPSWKNLLTGKTDIKALKKTLQLRFQKYFKAPPQKNVQSSAQKPADTQKLNKAFFESFESLIQQQKKFLFITAQKDGGAESFKTYFQEKYLTPGHNYQHIIDTCFIENANHIYAFSEWQEKLISKIVAYVKNTRRDN